MIKEYTYDNPKKHLQPSSVFTIKQPQKDKRRKWQTIRVRPVDGEECYNQLGLSAGFIHFADPESGFCIGFCGVSYFDEHAFKIKP